ncbi:MAG: usg protein [Alphaproteobacteria bacterium]
MADLGTQLSDYRLITAQIIYHLPDHVHVLQEFIWQDYDLSPKYPVLIKFLDFWKKEIEGTLHSVYVARNDLITPGDYRFAKWQETLQ